MEDYELSSNNPVKTVSCDQWEFDNSIFSSTIVQEWLLVCDREVLARVAQMIFMFGILVGSFVFGVIADWYGRRGPLICSVIVQVCAGVATAFSSNLVAFSILRFIDAVATAGAMVTSFVIIMELVGRKWRSTASVLYHIPFAIGHITLSGVSYYFRDWRQYQMIISLPSLLLVSYYWLVPESPRWLMTNGRVEEAKKIIKQAARRNGLPITRVDEILSQFKVEGSVEKKGSFLDLFRYPTLRTYTLCMAYQWLVCGIGFFGIAQYMGQVAGNVFLNVSIGGFLEIPGAIICIFATDKYGRRITLAASNLITGLACLSIIINMTGVTPIVLSAIGMVGMSVAFPTVYLYSGEIFPTIVRNVGVGFVVMSARIGSMAAPFISGLDVYGKFVPPLIFGLFPIVACLLCYLLPETKNKKLPDTLEEVNDINDRMVTPEITRF